MVRLIGVESRLFGKRHGGVDPLRHVDELETLEDHTLSAAADEFLASFQPIDPRPLGWQANRVARVTGHARRIGEGLLFAEAFGLDGEPLATAEDERLIEELRRYYEERADGLLEAIGA